jgi:WD40 repeat protein
VFQYAEIEGDINSLVVHPKKNLLAFSDDSYSIYLIPITEDGLFSPPQGKFYKSLRRVHSNIVYSLLFTDNNRKEELFSGGFDLSLCFWDAERGRPNKSITIEAEMKNESQTLNPPFVYAMQLISQGKILVVALGDGSVRIYSFKLGKSSSIFKQVRLYHAGSLSPIGYKTIHSGAIMTMKVIGNFVITGGTCFLGVRL